MTDSVTADLSYHLVGIEHHLSLEVGACHLRRSVPTDLVEPAPILQPSDLRHRLRSVRQIGKFFVCECEHAQFVNSYFYEVYPQI